MSELWKLHNISLLENCELSSLSKELLESIGVRVVSPMVIQGTPKGILLVGKKMGGEDFSEENLLFIDALSSTAISSIENERLFQEELEKKRLERELELALEIQKNLLPKTTPHIAGYDTSGISIPSLLVGGDYFDYIALPGDRTLVAIADVSGKGMPAALLMANVQAALRVLAPLDLPLTVLVDKINSIVYQNTSADKFVTFFCGVLTHSTGNFDYVNAGHNPPLHVTRDLEVNKLTEGGIILGIADAKFPYSMGNITMQKGETIVFYTDGITESINTQNKEFGEDALQFEIMNNLDLSALDLKQSILNAVSKHSEGMNQFDDLTLVVLKSDMQ
jgi:sigma-B regulation protein RsbU (phosphoserine phosphatase)